MDGNPKEGSYFNPLEVVDTKITVRDLLDSFGNIKPFEVVSQATGITLEMYQMRCCRYLTDKLGSYDYRKV